MELFFFGPHCIIEFIKNLKYEYLFLLLEAQKESVCDCYAVDSVIVLIPCFEPVYRVLCSKSMQQMRMINCS